MKDIPKGTQQQKTAQNANTSIWPDHYTEEDIGCINRINDWVEGNGYTKAALARLSRVSQAALSQVLSGKYAVSPKPLLVKVASALDNADLGQSMTPVVETSVFRLAYLACQMARKYRNFAVLTGYVGTGKTFALKHYAKTHPNTTLIEANPCMTPQSLIKQMARIIAGLEKGSIADKFDELVSTLKDTDSLIIIDEAETLTPNQLHTIRRLRDVANIGVVLSGTEHLSGLIRPAHGQFDQIRSRAGFWPETIHGIKADDAAALTQSAFGAEEVPEEVIDRLFAYSKGSARMLVEGLIVALKEFRRDRPLTPELVDAAAEQGLCLSRIRGQRTDDR